MQIVRKREPFHKGKNTTTERAAKDIWHHQLINFWLETQANEENDHYRYSACVLLYISITRNTYYISNFLVIQRTREKF